MSKSQRWSRRRAGLAAVVLAVAGTPVLAAAPAQAGELISESFSGVSTRPGEWEAPSPKGTHNPCLTAAATTANGSLRACNAVAEGGKPDPAGQGVFQLTDNSKQDAGGLVLSKPLTAGNGLQVDFDFYMYNSSTPKAADGISFFLLDGSQPATTGEPGGSLGYKGVKGAIVGLGFDQYGNFVTPTAGASDITKPMDNTIGVRGAESTDYKLLKTVKLDGKAQPLDAPADKSRSKAKRHVSVKLSSNNFLSLSMDFNNGKGSQELIKDLDLDHLPGQPKLPPSLKLGFAASTGGHTSYHELSGFSARELAPDVSVKATGEASLAPGGTGKVRLEVANSAAAGPTTGTVTATYKLPAGVTAGKAGGEGWDCKVADQTVTCTRPDVLKPGSAAPPITIDFTAGAAVKGTLTGTAGANTPGNQNTSGATVPFVQNVAAPAVKAPAISVAITHDGDLGPGAATYHVVTSNAKTAGPTTGPVTSTFTAPEGMTIRSASGTGWTCRTEGRTVTCTRPAALAPGISAPPVNVYVDIPESAVGTKAGATATAATPGDTDPAGNTDTDTATVTSAPVKAPGLTLELARSGTPAAGGTVYYNLTAMNDPGAGPTKGKVSAVLTAPPGAALKRVDGAGWTCGIDGQKATCTRSDALQPGKAYPRIEAELAFPAGSAGQKLSFSAVVGEDEKTDDFTVGKPAPGSVPGLPLPLDTSILYV